MAYPGVLQLQVDVTDVERRVFNVHESIPVQPGSLTLLYPEWLPGNHAPRGPIDALAGLRILANGHALEWVRDALNVYAFHLRVPPGVRQLELQFQFVSPFFREQGRTVVTPDMLELQWNTVVLYPAGYYVSRIVVEPTVILPESWQFAGALEISNRNGNSVRFQQTSLAMLVDSPLFAGRYFRTFDLAPGQRIPVHLDVVADDPDALEVRPQQLAAHRRLVQEAYALFGPPHFDRYEFLFALSEQLSDIGLEHHRSSENRRSPGYFTEWDKTAAGRDLLPHEFSHSWNGKYRRPAGLATPNFNVPMRDALLWVYEGLSNYLQGVLAARSGLWSPQFTREAWAQVAANMDRNRPGRAWRDLEDTTAQPLITARRPLSWVSWQRTEDYYPEGELLWLDADTRIRELTHGRRSLDDFARAFFGVAVPPTRPASGPPENGPAAADQPWGPVTYTLEDVLRTLNDVARFDWAGFFSERLHGHGPGAPLDGLTRGGWKLVYVDSPSDYVKSREEQRKALDFIYSLGFAVSLQSAVLTEVRWGSPAYDAGLTPGTALIAVNGREYRQERLAEAIVTARLSRQPVELLVKNQDRYRIVRIAYFDGPKYPQLQRLEKTADRLSEIMKPRT